jgi:hypothetical protein
MPNKRWSDLGSAQKGTVVLSGAVQLGLLAAALVDIWGGGRRLRSGATRNSGPQRRS